MPKEEVTRLKVAERPHQLTIGLSIGAAVVAVLSAWWSTGVAKEVARATIYDRAAAVVLELDKLYVSKPHLRPYFYENRELEPGSAEKDEVHAVAEMTIDVMHTLLAQIHQNPSHYSDAEGDRAWILDAFKRSKVLRDYFDRHTTWYSGDPGRELSNLRRQVPN